MKSRFLLLILVAAAFSSCSTSYKSGQTPDDVYYSPEKEGAAYVETKPNKNRYQSYEYDEADDRWLRMRVRNPYRWNAFDDYDWNTYSSWSNNYNSPYSNNWNSYWTGYYSWNSGYNPYCRNVVIVNPKSNPAAYNKVRNFSLNSYTNTNFNNSNAAVRTKGSMRLPSSGGGSYNNSNSNTLGSSLRKVFSGTGSNNTFGNNNGSSSGSSDRSSRSYTPSSSNSGSSSGSSSPGSSSSGGGSSSGGSSSGRRGG